MTADQNPTAALAAGPAWGKTICPWCAAWIAVGQYHAHWCAGVALMPMTYTTSSSASEIRTTNAMREHVMPHQWGEHS